MHLSPYKKTHFNNNIPHLHHHHHHHIHDDDASAIDMHNNTTTTNSTSRCSSDSGEPCEDGKWACKLLKECAIAISQRDSTKIHHLLWMLNELASPYGDLDQKLASYFLQALFCKATESGHRCYKTLSTVAQKSNNFDSARKLILKFQEVSPWTTFGHVAANGAILEALEGESNLHIIDISNTLCTQWPTLFEALATRNDETPRLRLTVVALSSTTVSSVMKEVGQRMEKFARLMGVPFEFNVINGLDRLGELTKESLGITNDEAIAVNCIGALRRIEVEERESAIRMFRSLNPKVVTVVEEEADFSSNRNDFVQCFEECLKFYGLYFEMLEESFPLTSNERLMLERDCSRSIVRVLACGGGDEQNNNDENNNKEEFEDCCERRERGTQWCEKLKKEFSGAKFSDDVVDDVKALLKRYRGGWSLVLPQQQQQEEGHNSNYNNNTLSGIFLTWKEEPVVWASAWKP
ncbi:protein SHORT-ROOT-like [Arachis stenosperma]|uniref:protein SHORT-ROOT-like n=1 Tax=Arachis stenosperma TaxID=217475 RepID=UPI0025ACF178|nr:protein SHORT-ROOT-like [Arachis stenosperma]